MKEKIEEEFSKWKEDNLQNIEIIKGCVNTPEIMLSSLQFEEAPINKNNVKDIKVDISCNNKIFAPIQKNQVIGKVEVKVKDEVILSVDIIVKEEVKKKNTFNFMKQLVTNYNLYLHSSFIN